MKKQSLIVVFIIFSLSGCKKNNSTAEPIFPNSIIGKWKLVSTYSDPGTGRGKFIAYDGPDLNPIEFNSDSTYKNSNSECVDRFSIRSNQYITLLGICKNLWTDKFYYFILSPKHDSLTLYYNCFEICGGKYVRVLK